MLIMRTEGSAQHGIALAASQQHRADQCAVLTYAGSRDIRCHTLAPHELVVVAPDFAIARIALGIDDLEVLAGGDAQPVALDARGDDLRAADEDGPREPLIDNDLHGAQHALVLAFGE